MYINYRKFKDKEESKEILEHERRHRAIKPSLLYIFSAVVEVKLLTVGVVIHKCYVGK